jgi:hypothetical protein
MTPKEELAGLRQLVKAIDDGVVLMSEKGITRERVAHMKADIAGLEKRFARLESGSNAHRT